MASLDYGRARGMMRALYQNILALPQADGVPLLRYFLGESTSASARRWRGAACQFTG